jgi:hypothetical protein
MFFLRNLQMWMEVGVAYLKALSQHLLAEPEECCEIIHGK